MTKVIIIHGWDEKPSGQWLPWLSENLREKGYDVYVPEMPNTGNPKLEEWMKTLEDLMPDENTILIGHSLGNALIMRYLEKANSRIKAAVMVAAWDWLMEDIKEYHQTFFEDRFRYVDIKGKNIPLVIINSTTDPYVTFDRARPLAEKIGAEFVVVENAGHFMERDGYKQFPLLLETILNLKD